MTVRIGRVPFDETPSPDWLPWHSASVSSNGESLAKGALSRLDALIEQLQTGSLHIPSELAGALDEAARFVAENPVTDTEAWANRLADDVASADD